MRREGVYTVYRDGKPVSEPNRWSPGRTCSLWRPMAIYFELAMAPTSLHEGPTLRSTKAVAMPTCALHHDAGAPPCPSCETPHARTCAPWVGVETHEYDCVCPLCREAWLLSDTDAEELFGVAMRSGSEEWEPNWSEEVLARGATSQEILDEWRPECWFREDQQERARKPSSHTLPPTRSDPAAPHRSPRSRRRRRTTRSTRRLASRHASTAPAALGGCFRVQCTLTLHAHCAHCAHFTPTTRPRAGPPSCTPTCTPAYTPTHTPTARPLHSPCAYRYGSYNGPYSARRLTTWRSRRRD